MNAGPLIFLAAMIAVFWFLLIRPQRQRQAAHRNLVAELAPGEEVVTVGGIFGKLTSVADDHVILEIAPGTEVRIAKEAVTGVVRKEETAASETENPRLT
jgi:preprotein translocase subunit YajC